MDVDSAVALLGLRPGYGAPDVRRAFRRQALNAHPDRGGSPGAVAALLEARRVLLGHLSRSPARVVAVDNTPVLSQLFRRWQRRVQRRPSRVL